MFLSFATRRNLKLLALIIGLAIVFIFVYYSYFVPGFYDLIVWDQYSYIIYVGGGVSAAFVTGIFLRALWDYFKPKKSPEKVS